MMSSLHWRLVPVQDYFNELREQIPKARKRVLIHAMDLRWGPLNSDFVSLLCKAAERDVEIRVVGDIYSKFSARMPRFARPPATSWRDTRAHNARLQASGGAVTYVGKLGFNPFKGRTHSKLVIIDDQIYAFGGSNFCDDSSSYKDYMLHTIDHALAERLYQLIRTIEQDSSQPLPNITEALNPSDTLLFDGGAPGQSVIYDLACNLVSQAQKVYLASQTYPSGRLARLLTATENYCYFIRPRQTEFPANLALILDAWRFKVINRQSGNTYIHAKFLLTEDKDGSRHLITGSHNFSWRGVAYGTKEMALHSTDEKLWHAVYDFLRQEIAS